MKTYVEANLEANLTKIMTGFPFEKKRKIHKIYIDINRVILTLFHYVKLNIQRFCYQRETHPIRTHWENTCSGLTIEILDHCSWTSRSVFIVHFVHVFVH